MVPEAFVYLEALPLTPSGKLDKKALPEAPVNQQKNDHYSAPETAVEAALVVMWSELLKVEKIGIEDDFFALGGNSLQASQIIARIRSEYKVDVPVKALFTEPSIKSLALIIEHEQSAGNILQEESIQSELMGSLDTSFEDSFAESSLLDEDSDEEFEL
jgi:acyl carrier protein